jgi:transcriptional regulator with XRE-family HTH domain
MERQVLAMSFGETVKSQRLSLNMDQEQIAVRMGITHQAVGNWERGFSIPTPAHLAELATILGLDPVDLATEAQRARTWSIGSGAAMRASAPRDPGRTSQSSYSSGSSHSTNYGSEERPVGIWGWVKFIIRKILGR